MRTYKHTSVLVSCEGEVQKVGGGSSGSDGGSIGGRFQTESWGDQGGWSDDEVQEGAVEKEAELETWLVLEYANRGSLESGIDRGWFQSEKTSTGRGPPSLPVLLHIARTLADAMAYLHNLDIIHGDLCGGNVLLTSSDAVPHRFTCKVADFGLARELYLQTRMETASYGTVTHMPPELLTEGKLSKAADVFAFGVLLWEMATGSRAWAGMSHTQVLTAVGYHHKRPIFPDYIDKDIAALANACMAQDARKRPTFREVVAAVDAKLAEVQKASFGQAASPFASWKPPPRQAST
jgi:serine/threonine protein kinase